MTVSRYNGKNNLAKPIFMLSILHGIKNESVIDNRIVLTESLLSTYKAFFKEYSQQSMTSPIYPFYYLKGDGFYHLIDDCSRKSPSVKYLRENVESAALDNELWQLLQNEKARNEIKEAIISYFIRPVKE
ncbi:hypothetical protein EV202_12254 [Bacteroides heparinolyticus]|uniref:ScoMcrA-like DNA sulfur-binding domain-containing protein n=1 Tax=Prevotella heparinolytica TaxID=28113 RepID=A0A4R2LG79_9BACE|nr:hypothetical protein [Bacteroides heparinolyticus]TCO89168.1 hypothetical protein EV202_12254 [Bacteroides heparinolyticus]